MFGAVFADWGSFISQLPVQVAQDLRDLSKDVFSRIRRATFAVSPEQFAHYFQDRYDSELCNLSLALLQAESPVEIAILLSPFSQLEVEGLSNGLRELVAVLDEMYLQLGLDGRRDRLLNFLRLQLNLATNVALHGEVALGVNEKDWSFTNDLQYFANREP